MYQDAAEDTRGFFQAQQQAFAQTLAQQGGQIGLLPALLTQAFTSFEGNVDLQAEDAPALACHKGCATCCTIRVVATAPEVLLVARYIRSVEDKLKQEGIDLPQRLAQADTITRGSNEQQRVKQRQRCPYIHKGACVIYPVRPLACRGHVSYDKRACAEAAAGHRNSIPYAESHMMLRSLIQNAMQSALRDAGFAWATYELNHALSLALADDDSEAQWLTGEDVFAAAVVADVSQMEMAQTYDQLR